MARIGSYAWEGKEKIARAMEDLSEQEIVEALEDFKRNKQDDRFRQSLEDRRKRQII